MSKKTIYDYLNYKEFLNQKISSMPQKGRGIRLKLAQALSCQTAYISQVLNRETNFSLEQAVKVSQFFEFNKEESRFFLLLVQLERAGSHDLVVFLKNEIQDILTKRAEIETRVNITDSLDERNQHIYYSVWYYAAIHILLSIPEFQTPKKISEHLRLSLKKVYEVIDFLCETGLAKREGDRYFIGQTRIHLGKNTIQIRRHHTNWRNQAITSIDKNSPDDLHYSSVISMGKKDTVAIKEIMMKAIEECREVIRVSPEEQLQVMTIDFFKL